MLYLIDFQLEINDTSGCKIIPVTGVQKYKIGALLEFTGKWVFGLSE